MNGTRFWLGISGKCLKGHLPIACILLYTPPFCGFSSEIKNNLWSFGVFTLGYLHGAFACAQAKRRRSSVGCSGGDTFGSLEL